MKEGGRKQGAMSPCAACKLLRRRCAQDCVFAPYFPADEPQKFASVHKVFGASNVNKMLQFLQVIDREENEIPFGPSHPLCLNKFGHLTASYLHQVSSEMDKYGIKQHLTIFPLELPEHQRSDAVSSMVYEANARVRDPVYGCVGAISSLQQQVDVLQTQLALAQAEVVHMKMHQFTSISSSDHHHHQHHQQQHPSSSMPAASNSSSENNLSPSSRLVSSQTKSLFAMDMVVDQANMGQSLWSC